MSVKFHDYYKTLEVDKSASDKEIKAAYRKLARKYHPDVNKESGAEDRFKEINEAYEVLKDPEKRQRYDQLGSNWQAGQEFDPSGYGFGGFDFSGSSGQGFSGSGFSDFFDILFGGAARGGNPFSGGMNGFSYGARQPVPMDGQDKETDLTITLREAFQGAAKKISLRSVETTASGQRRQRTDSIEVKVPPKATEGMKIRVRGKGSPGRNGGRPGDLYLRIRIRDEDNLQVSGKDILTTVTLSPWDAILGTKVSIPFLDETISLKIPPGTGHGDKLRLAGKGLKNRTGQGDLLVSVKIDIPKSLSPESLKLVEKIKELEQGL